MYSQDHVPRFDLTIATEEWRDLQDEWNNGLANKNMGLDPKPYHAVTEFRYGNVRIASAEIRLRGNPEFWDPIPGDKMQFQVRFRDDEERFLGLERLALDAATFNRHMLRDRLALAIMRDVGIRAPCANHARLFVNGDYYGIFTNVEKIDRAFLARAFEDSSGDLWKRADWEIKTNKGSANADRLQATRTVKTAPALQYYLDLNQALRVFAAEAVIPNSDGMWAGGLNFYIYDDPVRGKYALLPWDLDNTFERFSHAPEGDYPANPDPLTWEKPTTHGRPWYDIALQDPDWLGVYIDLVADVVQTGYVPETLHERIDTWTLQIQDAVFADVNKPYSDQLYVNKVAELHAFVDARHAYLEQWLACWRGGGGDCGG